MNLFFPLLTQIVIMFVLMAIGLLLVRTKLMSTATTKDLGKLLLYAVFPAIIIKSYWVEFSLERALALALTFVLSLAALVIAMIVARITHRRDGVAQFSAAFSNAGFIGIPLIQSTLGEDAVFYSVCFIALLNILQWTYGQYLLTRSRDCLSLRSTLTSPMLVSFAVGVVLFVLHVPQIPIALNLLTTLGNLNTPLAMIILGAYLAESSPRALFLDARLYGVSLVRLAVIPLVTAAFFALIPADATMKLAILIAAATPTGANVAIFCQQRGGDYTYACNMVCMTTLLSIVSIPVIIGITAGWM